MCYNILGIVEAEKYEFQRRKVNVYRVILLWNSKLFGNLFSSCHFVTRSLVQGRVVGQRCFIYRPQQLVGISVFG